MLLPKEIVDEILFNTDINTFTNYILNEYDNIPKIIFYFNKYFEKNDTYFDESFIMNIKHPLVHINEIKNIDKCVFFLAK